MKPTYLGRLLAVALTLLTSLHATAWLSGQQWTTEVQNAYQQGQYAPFLKQVDQTFQEGEKQDTWKTIREKELARDASTAAQYNTPEGKKRFDETSANVDAYIKAVNTLKQERDQALQKIATTHPDAPISKLIQARYAITPLTAEQIKAFDTVDAWLSPFPLNSNPLIPQLRAIDLNFRIKTMLLDRGLIPHLETTDKDTLERYRLVLILDKFHSLLRAVKQANQSELSDPLDVVTNNYPTISAEERDGLAIEHLSQMPLDEASKQSAAIIKSFKEKQTELRKKFGI